MASERKSLEVKKARKTEMNPEVPKHPGARRLSRRAQILVVLVAAAAVALLAGGGELVRHFFGAQQKAAAPALPPGVFRPTKEQWTGLKVMPVRARVFRT